MPPEMPALASSALSSVEHDCSADRLYVTFTSGRRYVYLGVDARLYQTLIAAESKGRFFNEHIRNAFPSCRLSDLRGLGR